ncbi:DUF1152 domain-containing protein [Streptomyces sp. DT2A-34]|uniref:DUF1152 domain-containing protein n=1 Tax=Streptomyces sp. DT2A-34 TaxID=3051182 RepID=UPI00265BF7DE|nr:DUF1152 domain-containing protein [Streptomyces sp. DT2A-34]MDO0917369.1 DUF1152 domain-containing protein [Streptomyces sp. DT2A-34]
MGTPWAPRSPRPPWAAPSPAHPSAGPRSPRTPGNAWERLEADPTPGPLGAVHFTGLDLRTGVPVIAPATRPIAPAGSTLPDLAADLTARLVLLDLWQGPTAPAEQIRRLADAGHDHVRIVDVGDILTHGDEDTLCRPLVDALVLAACRIAGVPATMYVAGPGTDGEIPRRMSWTA